MSPFDGLGALTGRELKKWYRWPAVLLMTTAQPIIWMLFFGNAFNFSTLAGNDPRALAGLEALFGTSDYFSYMAVGMLSFLVLFATVFSGMSVVWDRRWGFMSKVLSTPASRGSIILSKVVASVGRSLVQATLVLVVAVPLGLHLGADFQPAYLLGVFAALSLLGIGLSAVFVMIAIRSSHWETQMAIMNLLNLPLLFASNALFPIASMPSWLQDIAKVNPVTYGTDAVRQLLLLAPDMASVANDFLFLGAFAAVFTTLGVLLAWRFLSG